MHLSMLGYSYAHISGCSNESIRDGIDQLARDSEITEFYLSFRIEQNIGGLDVYRRLVKGWMPHELG